MLSPARIWSSSLRLRLTVTGTLLAGVIFAIAGPVAIALYHQSLTRAVWDSDIGGADEVAARVRAAQPLPDPIPMPVSPDVPRIQVLNPQGQVITGDPLSAGGAPMYRPAGSGFSERTVLEHPEFLDANQVAVYTVASAGRSGPETVVAAISLDPATEQAREAIALSVPLALVALLMVGAVSWLTAGWALQPVERLRRQAEVIAASGDLSARLAGQGSDELSRLGRTLNVMLGSLDSSVHRQRRFVADAAHELRTPLAGMVTALEVAQTHPAAGETLVEDLLAGHRRLGRLVNDLLILAAADGRAPRRADPVSLAGVVTDCCRRTVPDGIALRLGQLDPLLVLGDEAQLGRVVGNLVDNALRYAATAVEVSVRRDGAQAVIAVVDDGQGIPAGDRDRIWERFARLDDDRSRASGGSGLGLAMVRELTAAHGGTVSVAGRPAGPGAAFTVRLPALR